MGRKIQNNVFSKINELEMRLNRLEVRLEQFNEKIEESLEVIQSQMVRIKNGERLPDDFVQNRRRYNDLSPEKAHNLYQEEDTDFMLLDVSAEGFQAQSELPEAVKIPLEELAYRLQEVGNKTANLLIISEDGTRSILACELLNKLGYFNINNISGGYKYWPQEKSSARDLKSA